MDEKQKKVKYLTTAEAAVKLGVTRRRVLALIKARKLDAKRFGKWAYAIPEDVLERLIAERKEQGIQ